MTGNPCLVTSVVLFDRVAVVDHENFDDDALINRVPTVMNRQSPD